MEPPVEIKYVLMQQVLHLIKLLPIVKHILLHQVFVQFYQESQMLVVQLVKLLVLDIWNKHNVIKIIQVLLAYGIIIYVG